jgi:hypothetical protein
MRHIARAGLMASAFWLALLSTPAVAQQRCTEGKTVSGACVNPLLAGAMRQIGVIFSQPKISRTAYPVLPSGDRRYRYPNQLNPNQLQSPPCCGPPIP